MAANPDLYDDIDDEEAQILPAGSVVAERYMISEVLGRGGMGVVYKAEQVHMERSVALKMMLEPTSVGTADYRRFEREAKAASLLDHPNIVAIHDFGYLNKQAYLCMDYLEGKSLDQILQKAPLKLDHFRHVFKQACDALQHAHDKGIVHRDIKPSNIMITERRNDKWFVVILDFGLVKMADGKADHKLTATNMVLGSPLYMSPEQCRAVDLDHRSDIYSLGCVMYEALTGIPPLTADTVFDVMNKHISATPIPMRDANPGAYIPPALEQAIMHALAKSPDDRPKSMADLHKEIEKAFSGAPETVLPTSKVRKVDGDNSRHTRQKKRKTISDNIGLILMFPLIGIFFFTGMWLDHELGPEKYTRKNAGSGAKDYGNNSGAGTSGTASSSTGNEGTKTGASPWLLPAAPPATPQELPQRAAASSSFKPTTDRPKEAPAAPALPAASATRPVAQANIDSSRNAWAPSQATISSSQARGTSSEQLLAEANIDFGSGRYSEARRKYEELLDKSNPENKVLIYGRLVLASYSLKDFAATSHFLEQFKDQFNFDQHGVENEGILLHYLFEISRMKVSGSEDSSFSERLALAAIDALSDHGSRPSQDTVRMKLELNRLYMEQQKRSDSEALLAGALSDAERINDTTLIAKVNELQQGPSGGFSGPGNGPGGPQGGMGPPGFPPQGMGPPGGGPPGGGPPGGRGPGQ